MKISYNTEIYTDDFKIDIAEKGGCKGLLKIEVFVVKNSVPLLLKDGSNQRFFGNSTPFVLQSLIYPITSGVLKFEFLEIEALQDNQRAEKKAIVRFLYCD